MENALITLKDKKPVWKDKALQEATDIIYSAANAYAKTADESRKVIAATLAKVESAKLYKEDGFDSLADFAEEGLGIKKSLAHKLENAGRLLLSDNATVKEFAAKTDYSKLSILASAKEEDVQKAIESGALNEKTTQREVTEWKKTAAPKKDRPVVVPKWHVEATFAGSDGKHDKVIDAPFMTPAEIGPYFMGEATATAKVEMWGKTVYLAISESGDMAYYTADKIKEEKKSGKKASPKPAPEFDITKMTPEEIEAYLAKRKAEAAKK